MRRWRSAILLLSFGLILSGCSAAKSGGSGAGKSTTLRLGYYEDIQSPDPDVAYDIPGLALVNNVYEGLVKYETGDSTTIVPGLATEWTVSPDSLTYTFTLRTGVSFHDGTPFNAAAAKASFERRLGMKQGAYYMVQDIGSLDASDAQTLVITLIHPTSAFMDYLASPYGVKMTSPTAIKAHTMKDDFGVRLDEHPRRRNRPVQDQPVLSRRPLRVDALGSLVGPEALLRDDRVPAGTGLRNAESSCSSAGTWTSSTSSPSPPWTAS